MRTGLLYVALASACIMPQRLLMPAEASTPCFMTFRTENCAP
jgi:hypothetical protein